MANTARFDQQQVTEALHEVVSKPPTVGSGGLQFTGLRGLPERLAPALTDELNKIHHRGSLKEDEVRQALASAERSIQGGSVLSRISDGWPPKLTQELNKRIPETA